MKDYNKLLSQSRFFNKTQPNKKLKIGLVTPHNWPIPWITYGGEKLIIDLAIVLVDIGHEVSLYAPAGTENPSGSKLYPMRCSYGQTTPSSEECEQSCFDNHINSLREQDIVHDFSITKKIAENLFKEGKRNIMSTNLGGVWTHPNPAYNLVCQSYSMKDRALRGATDYENSPTPDAGGDCQLPVKDAHVVYNGIDTQFYSPTNYQKEDYYLWLNRWHPVKGYSMMIELAKQTGINLVMSAGHPDAEWSDYQRQCALDAMKLAFGIPNIKFIFLPFLKGHHEAKRELYRNAKAFLFPTQFQEPFGIGQIEALACGTPIIGTNFGSVPEIVEDSLTGYVVENSVRGYIEAISKIDKIDPKVCREHAIARFDRQVMAKNYLKEYYDIIDGKCWGL